MSKYGLTREAGESDLDWRRRYHRELMRIKAAEKPKRELRGPAPYVPKVRKPRKGWPGTEEQWLAAQKQPGEDHDEWKRRNARIRHELNKDRYGATKAANAKAWRAENRDRERNNRKIWEAANPDKVKAGARKYFEANREKRLSALNQWRIDNPERNKERVRQWWADNPDKRNFYASKWRAAALQATPAWADLDAIQAIYTECVRISEETGIEHHVDHYYPLQGKTVCGLHVENNLRIIDGVANMKKGNRMPNENEPLP